MVLTIGVVVFGAVEAFQKDTKVKNHKEKD